MRRAEALARQVMVLCELEGGGDWRLARFLSVNGLQTRKRCVLWFHSTSWCYLLLVVNLSQDKALKLRVKLCEKLKSLIGNALLSEN